MELKSQDEKKRLEREKQEAKEKMNLEIQGWSKRYEELKMQKSQIEKESNNLLKNMEATNLKAVEVSIMNLIEKPSNPSPSPFFTSLSPSPPSLTSSHPLLSSSSPSSFHFPFPPSYFSLKQHFLLLAGIIFFLIRSWRIYMKRSSHLKMKNFCN